MFRPICLTATKKVFPSEKTMFFRLNLILSFKIHIIYINGSKIDRVKGILAISLVHRVGDLTLFHWKENVPE